MHGAPNTLYEGEQFHLQVDFPEHYPMEAPQVLLPTCSFPILLTSRKMFHGMIFKLLEDIFIWLSWPNSHECFLPCYVIRSRHALVPFMECTCFCLSHIPMCRSYSCKCLLCTLTSTATVTSVLVSLSCQILYLFWIFIDEWMLWFWQIWVLENCKYFGDSFFNLRTLPT